MLAGFTNIKFEFGARTIVDEATWHIQPGERIGLIGYNGTGKSTLLKLLVGEYKPSAGMVERSKSTSIGYLHQDLLSFDTESSILEVALGAFERVLQLEKEIEEIGKTLERTGDEKTLIEYTDRLHELETLGGYTIHHRTEEVLQGLGFSPEDLRRPYREFSGGWRMRVLLAKMILQQPDLLLLDEPTNHLDLPSIEWLEKYLIHYQGSVVIVSHDKYFLNRMVTKIVELYQQQLHIYNGNYDFYEKEKAVRIDLQQKAFENQQEFIRQQERFIERFKAKASKAAQAQSIQKKLDRLERLEDVALERPNININFRMDKIPGKVVSTLRSVGKSFGNNQIIENTSIEINRGDKIALIGANGKGKSTLLRIIAGTENHTGERVEGHNVAESFYAQHQLEALDLQHTVLDELKGCGSQMTEQELRNLLGCFLFGGDDVEKKIKVLSGGEKARVALAKTIVSRANFLLLDEPTNHLDMHSVELLAEALQKYEGTYLFVSHDRYFIAKAANKIWEIEDHRIKEFVGGYEEWVEWKKRMETSAIATNTKETNTVVQVRKERSNEPSAPQQKNGIPKDVKKEWQRLQKRFQLIEGQLADLQSEGLKLQEQLSSPEIYGDREKFLTKEKEYQENENKQKSASSEYEQLFEKIMALESKYPGGPDQ